MNLFLAACCCSCSAITTWCSTSGGRASGLASYRADRRSGRNRTRRRWRRRRRFIVNRVGDAGYPGHLPDVHRFGTVSFTGVFGTVGSAGSGVATALGLAAAARACEVRAGPVSPGCLDAMEGPIPRCDGADSTPPPLMVTGVYLLVRSTDPRAHARRTARVALSARSSCCSAASSPAPRTTSRSRWPGPLMSQIGYMFLGAASGRPPTCSRSRSCSRAVLQAGLFLGAGSVMHAG